ncbi:MAG: ATP-binding protein [Chloroflexota bacterium]
MNSRPKILIVDDKPQNLFALEVTLQKLDLEVLKASSGEEALGLTLDHDFCVAIVDVQMPEMDGYELVELMRSYPAMTALPVIFVSAIFSDEYHHRKGYDAGAVDFLSKPFVPEILLSKVKVFVELYQQRRQLQETVEQLNQSNAALARRAMQLEISSKVGQQVTAILDLESLLSQVVHVIEAGFGYSRVAIWLLNDSDQTCTIRACSGGCQADLDALALQKPDAIIEQVLRGGAHYLSNDVAPPSLNVHMSREMSLLASQVVLPLKAQSGIVGVLDIQSERRSAFAEGDIVALQIIADQVAIAIRNARLYSQVVRFNEQLEHTVQERTAELQRAYQILEKLDKTKSDFIEIAAHELRTPLTLIQGYAEMLADIVTPIDGAEKMVRGILKGESRLLEVINTMLDISRLDTETIEAYKKPASMASVLRQVESDFENAWAERQLVFSLQGLDGLPACDADPDLLRKLFRQLVGNAIKYTPDGGKITITGDLRPPGELADPAVAAVHVAIADTGIGIDPAQQELIFEKFYQTGPVMLHSTSKTNFKGGGPGLGLAVARGIVNVHGGKVWAESPGYDEEALPGSTFHVLLPVRVEVQA